MSVLGPINRKSLEGRGGRDGRGRRAAPALLLALLGALVLLTAGPANATATGTTTRAAAPGKLRISLRVPGRAAPGARILARGRVAPAPAHGRVVVQVHKGSGWRPLGHGPLQSGAFAVRVKLPSATGPARLRALALAGGRRLAASTVRTVRVRPRSAGRPTPVVPAPGPIPTPAPPAAADPLSAASLLASIDAYSSLPDHLSGTANSAAALDEFSRELGAAGLRLGQQAFAFPRFTPTAVGLSVAGAPVPAAAIAPLLYSGTTPQAGTTATLFDGGDGSFDKTKVAGRIVVVSVTYKNNSKADKLIPAIEAAVEGKAAGLVAVTQAVGDYPKWEDVNARRGTGPMPVLMVGKRSGNAVIAAAAGAKPATLTLAATTGGTSCDRDVWGELEGSEPGRRVFIATPASSFTPSASEHGSGVAITIGLARHYAALPKAQRPATLVFMVLGGHEIGWLGLQSLMTSSYGPWFKGGDAYVHLGSALGAPRAHEEPDGTIVTTTEPDPTGRLHESENPLLESSVIEDWVAAGVPTPETPPHEASGGEQTYAYTAGLPTASFSGASLFFHTAGDLPGTVDPRILAADADAFRRTVDTITAIPPGQLRAQNAHAEELGKSINPDVRAPTDPTQGSGGSLGSGGVGGPPATPVAQCPAP